jgi:hypothetical protein
VPFDYVVDRKIKNNKKAVYINPQLAAMLTACLVHARSVDEYMVTEGAFVAKLIKVGWRVGR